MPGLQTAFAQGLAANRPAPAASNAGFMYFSTDTGLLAQSTGSAWVALAFSNPLTTQDDLLVGGAAGAPGRLGKGTDGQVLTVDPTTHHLVWATPAAGGMSDPTTTKGDLLVHGTTTTRLPVGTDGQVLTADSTQTLGVAWAAAGAASLATASASLGADVTMSSANTFYDGPSVSLAAGTWLVIGCLGITPLVATADFTAKLWDGTTAYDSVMASQNAGYWLSLPLAAIVTPASTTSYKLSAAADNGTAHVIRAAAPANSAGNNASSICALNVA